ncbi:hypothetical protein LJC08_04370 [Methanimicrococcus sp. OttesenSCG-928-J09]|nr:hypothetical protein [Methanimicrococcus sp. OttesenSCG-928-J09]
MSGCFYFISDEFFERFPDKELLKNKGMRNSNGGKRPCFLAFEDLEYSNISWMIPISSKIEKYQAIQNYNFKKNGRCDIIHISSLLGKQTAFVIQKMFPITQRYIEEKYTIRKQENVRIQKDDEKEIIEKANRILMLHKNKIPVITPDIDHILKNLTEDME